MTRCSAVVRDLNAAYVSIRPDGLFREFSIHRLSRFSEGGHYDWHVDHGPLKVQRKLSVSLQLSHGESYDGCDLQFVAGNKTETGPRERGAVIAFPSYILHRVTPITRGVRKSIVVWVTGPKFR